MIFIKNNKINVKHPVCKGKIFQSKFSAFWFISNRCMFRTDGCLEFEECRLDIIWSSVSNVLTRTSDRLTQHMCMGVCLFIYYFLRVFLNCHLYLNETQRCSAVATRKKHVLIKMIICSHTLHFIEYELVVFSINKYPKL